YQPGLDRRDASVLNLHGELRHGIATGELRLHHQPQVDLRTGRVTGVEALVRWQHPTRGLLPPSAFLDLAEQTGLVRELTTAVLDRALRDHVAWAARGRVLPVAVNLSTRSLTDDRLPGEVSAALARHGVDPGLLELEITESVAVQDPRQALLVLEALRAAGVQVAVDDYGTGHSSLTYLSQLPLTTLKIDRSFVQAMAASARDLTIVRSTIELGHGLGHRVVAEGVETQDAWRWLQTLGCDDAQGYWLARPVPASDLLACAAAMEDRLGAAHPVVDAAAPATS
ncbi:MAG TPA: EAL domain-containing protein, partial [Actinomycetales bacterium]